MDKSIIECRYEAGNAPGWRWIPIRIRHDKTERFQKGIIGRTMNKDEFAEEVWNSIHDPITYHMIRTGSDSPSQAEIEMMSGAVAGVAKGEVSKVYYERKAAADDIQLIRGLRDFHRLYIKENLLLGTGLKGGGKVLVDLACGQGGDLSSWVRNKAKFVYGTDIAGAGIRDPHNGAYRRYLNQVIKYGGYEEVPKMIFTIGSSAKVLSSGEAGATPEESNIMRSIYGRLSPDGPIPPFVQKYGAGQLREGADCVAIMFAIHYFFESDESLTGFLHGFFPHFDADETIKKMMKSKKWPESRWYGMTAAAIKAAWDANGREASEAGTAMHLGIEMVMNETNNPNRGKRYTPNNSKNEYDLLVSGT